MGKENNQNMSRFILAALISLFLLGFSRGCIPDFSPLDPAALYSHVLILSVDIGSRNVVEPGNLIASAYIKDKFEEYGLFEPHFEYYTDDYGTLCRNVVATCPGSSNPEKIILIEGHFDTKPSVPGAVDNATGIAALLEYARYFSSNPAPYTLKFIAFNGEEKGYSGSSFYHEKSIISGELANTLFVLNLDMMQSNASNPEAPLILFVMSPIESCIKAFLDTKAEIGISAANIHFIPAKFASEVSKGLRADVRQWIDDPVAICWPWAFDVYYNRPVDTYDKVDQIGLAISSKFVFSFLKRILKLKPEDFITEQKDYQVPPSIGRFLEKSGGIRP